MTRRAIGWSLAATISVACIAIALWRSDVFSRPIGPHTWQEFLQEGKSVYSSIPTRPLTEFSSVEMVRDAIRPMSVQLPQEVSQDASDRVVQEASEFLYYRFCQPSAEEYAKWRRSKGYSLKSKEKLIRPGLIDKDYPLYFGEPFPTELGADELFSKYWKVALTYGNGTNLPVAIATDRKGLACVIALIRKTDPGGPNLSGDLPAAMWTGATAMTMRNWWLPPKSMEALFAASANVPVAEVGAIVQYGDGSRRPLRLTYAYDSAAKSWILTYVAMNNFDRQVTNYSSLEF